MSAKNSGWFAAFLLLGGACRESELERVERARPETESPVLAVEGRRNQTPFLASKGDLVAAVWSAGGDGTTDLFLATSADGGHSFSEPRRVNDVPGDVNVYGEQPPRVAIGPGSPSPPIYVAWTSANTEKKLSFLRFSRSLDGGETFDRAVTLHSPDLPGERGWQSLSVSPRGIVHAVWLDNRPVETSLLPRSVPTVHAHSRLAGMGLYHLAWDGGARPEAERLFESVCECCKTALAIGGDGSVYAAWRHVYADNYRDIAFAASRDGARFRDATRVSQDGWQIDGCPDDGPSIAVDAADRVHVIWPTLVQERMDMGLFYASTENGAAFSSRSALPTSGGTDPSHPQLALDGSGRLVAVWDEFVEEKRRIVFIRGALAGDGSFSWDQPQILDDGADGVSATYPVAAASGTGVVVAWTSQAGDESVIRLTRIP